MKTSYLPWAILGISALIGCSSDDETEYVNPSAGGATTTGGSGTGVGQSGSTGVHTGGVYASGGSYVMGTGGNTGTPVGGATGTPVGGATGTPVGGATGTPVGGATGTPTGGTTGTPVGGTTGTPTGGTTGVGGKTGVGGATTVGGATGTGGGTAGPGRNNCPAPADMISDFEEGAGAPVVLPATGVTGAWEAFHNTASDGAVGTVSMAVEATGETTDCKKFALHTKGSGWGDATKGWIGFGLTNLAGTATAKPQTAYDATAKGYVGVSFRAKLGSATVGKSPVRFNLSSLPTEGADSGGTCTVAANCYNHFGRFLHQENALTTEWKTYSFCFDRDLHPLFLPSANTTAERDAVGKNLIKLQFQFNKGKDVAKADASTGVVPTYPTNDPFDIWVDDIQFVKTCGAADFKSDAGAKKPFPQNTALGTGCAPVTNAKAFSTPISQAYARWKTTFVQAAGSNLKVIAPEQKNATTSEAMGYGLMIAAAMGDKETFDKFWNYVSGNLANGLMDWIQGGDEGSNSATDGDEDIAYGLLMAAAQWPEGSPTGGTGTYASLAAAMIGEIAKQDLVGSRIKLGNQYDKAYNPSYFAPAAYRVFAATNPVFSSVITDGYARVTSNVSAEKAGLPTDWCSIGADTSCPPITASEAGAAVTGGFNKAVFGYDAARVPWRLGLDVCKTPDGGGATVLGSIITFLTSKYVNIDTMLAGIVKSSGAAADAAADGKGAAKMQASFIGSAGVGAMAVGKAEPRDRAFRTVLDILENPEFNKTYFPATVGLLTVLAMGGDFPMP